MKIGLFWFLSFLMIINIAYSASPAGWKAPGFDRKVYYTILKTGTLADMDQELTVVSGLPASEREAFSGTLLMKKAGLLHKPKDKLASFKTGRIRLETAIHADPANVEFRFLRLIIQEHAPKITKYNDRLKEDSEMVKEHVDQLPVVVRQVVKDYAQTSTVLNF